MEAQAQAQGAPRARPLRRSPRVDEPDLLSLDRTHPARACRRDRVRRPALGGDLRLEEAFGLHLGDPCRAGDLPDSSALGLFAADRSARRVLRFRGRMLLGALHHFREKSGRPGSGRRRDSGRNAGRRAGGVAVRLQSRGLQARQCVSLGAWAYDCFIFERAPVYAGDDGHEENPRQDVRDLDEPGARARGGIGLCLAGREAFGAAVGGHRERHRRFGRKLSHFSTGGRGAAGGPDGMNRFSQKSLDFIRKASRQKKHDWLDRNRAEYEEVLVEPMRALMTTVARELRGEAPGYRFPARSFARIRRSADRARAQGLYKDWIGVQVSRDSGSLFEDLPGLYFHMSYEDVFTAGGLYMPSSRQVKQIRAWIAEDASALERLLKDRRFKSVFREGLGDERKLKTFPRGYPQDHPRIEWLKLTGFYVWRPVKKREFFSSDFHETLAADWRQVLRLNGVLDRYLSSWPGASRRKLESFEGIRAPQLNWEEAAT